jgi:beta-N-acetylhexosaminidase
MIHYGLAGIMPAHVVYEQLDSMPAGFSRFWIQEILRTRLEFTGLIFSDDLSMAGAHVAGGYADRASAALEAGCDVVLVCNNRAGAIDVIDEIKLVDNPALQLRIAHMHGRGVKDASHYQQSDRWHSVCQAIRLLQDEFPVEQELDF